MPTYRLLLLDAVIVIALHELGIWSSIRDRCEIHLTRTIMKECKYWTDDTGGRHTIDLGSDERAGKIFVHDLDESELDPLRSNFGSDILSQLHFGEEEALAILYNSADDYRTCSADRIVFRILGALKRSDQGVSLEEILRATGLSRSLSHKFSKSFKEEWCRKGFAEGAQGLSSLH
ncbi:MAG: helix-turn-helix domain-containing protein [Capsulimonadaceae bacterium]